MHVAAAPAAETAPAAARVESVHSNQNDVVVTVQGAPIAARTSSTSVLSAREIRSAPLRSAEDSLELVPGLTLVQHGSEGKGQQIFLRGFDALHGADFEVTVDGLPINEPSNVHAHGYIDMGFVVPELIRSLRVTKGPFSVQQGPFSMAGSAEYGLGLPPNELGWRVGYGYGTTGRHRVVATYAPPNRVGDDFVAIEAVRDAGFGSNRGVRKATMLARASVLDSHEFGQLALWSASYIASFDLPGSLRDADVEAGSKGFFDTYDSAGHGRSTRTLAAASYDLARADHFLRVRAFTAVRHLLLVENFTGFLLDPVNGDRGRQRHDSVRWGVNASDDLSWGELFSTHLSLGLSQDNFTQSEERLDQTLRAVAHTQQLRATQTLAHGALAGRLNLGSPAGQLLRLHGGARIDLHHVASASHTPQWVWSPRMVAEVTALPEVTVFGAYGRGARPPEARLALGYEPRQLGLPDQAPAREPEWSQTQSFELGMNWRTPHGVSGAVSGFLSGVDRESVFDHVSGTTVELGSTERIGAEVMLSVRPNGWSTLTADASWARARFVASGNEVPFAPPLVAAVRGVATHPDGWVAGLHVVAIAPRPLPHGAKGSASTQVDATAGYHWTTYRLDFAFENVFNQSLREGEYYHASHWRRDEDVNQLPALHFSAAAPFNARMMLSAVF